MATLSGSLYFGWVIMQMMRADNVEQPSYVFPLDSCKLKPLMNVLEHVLYLEGKHINYNSFTVICLDTGDTIDHI